MSDTDTKDELLPRRMPPDTGPLRFVEYRTWDWDGEQPAFPWAAGVVEVNEFIHEIKPALEDAGFIVINWRNVSVAA